MGNTLAQYRKNGNLIPIMNMNPSDLPGERWVDIPGYADIYQLSDYGRLRTVDRNIIDKNGVNYFRKGYMRKVSIVETKKKLATEPGDKRFIAVTVALANNKMIKSYSLVRLIYSLFVEHFDIEDQTMIIVRKDNDYLNCHYSNLLLTSVSEHMSEGFASKGRESGFHKKIRPVNQYSTEGKLIETYSSVTLAAQKTRGNATAISDAARKEKMLSGNFYWRYGEALKNIDVSLFTNKRERYEQSRKRKVQQLTLDGILLNTFNSISEAAKATGIRSNSSIRNSCNNPKSIGKGFRWKFLD